MKAGFTLIEIAVAMAILMIVAVSIIPVARFFRGENELDSLSEEIIYSLKLAQSRTLASEGESNYGVYFAADRWVVFKGTSYSTSSADNQVNLLPGSILIDDISFNGATQVVFERLTGATQNNGSASVVLAGDESQSRTIYVDAAGMVSLSSVAPSDTARLADSRHIHVVFSQNTQSAAVLSITFPSDGVTQNINFQDFLNADKTEFSWSGTVTVNGVAQSLKVHTHSLGVSSTVFCFHRDRLQNDKAVQFSLDGQNLINYAAAGAVTQGASPWAAAPILQ